MRAVCPDCGACVQATETGEHIPGTNRATYKLIGLHPSKEEKAGSIVVWTRCDGVGKKV